MHIIYWISHAGKALSVQSIELAVRNRVVAVDNNRNRIVIVPCGEVRRFGDHGLDAMMSRANARNATSSFSPRIKSRDQG